MCFPVNFAKILRTPVFYRTPPVGASETKKMIWLISKVATQK